MTRIRAFVALVVFVAGIAAAQPFIETLDTATVLKIKHEGMDNSQVMEIASWLCDVYAPRLTWSQEYRTAADWVFGKFAEWELRNIHREPYAPVGKGWTLKKFTASVTQPLGFPLIAYPKAWSPRLKGRNAEVVWLDVKAVEDFAKYAGRLKGKYVLMNDLVPVKAPFEPLARRLEDSLLLKMANADVSAGRRGGRRVAFPRMTMQNFDSVFAVARQIMPGIDSAAVTRMIADQQVNSRKLEFVQNEGALAAISAGRGDGGMLLVQGASVPQSPDVPFDQRMAPYDPKAAEVIPQVVVAAEHYNRLVRMLQKKQSVTMAIELDVEWTKADSSFNLLAEIPGDDLKDEVVLIGGHFDTWHGGTGATDNSSGSAVCMEAMRILQTVIKQAGVKPRRTIRIGLWGGEEQGLFGSREYVASHYGKFENAAGSGTRGSGSRSVTTTADHEKFSVYFNNDNGTGRVRGVYMQGNDAVRPIFRAWLKVFNDPSAQTLTLENTTGTDHLSFDAVGLPGFQFIQDPIDYESRTHHSNIDVYERLQPDDLRQAATIMAVFAYHAAMRDAKFPRKPMPGIR